jgi:hypothetical protein
MPALSPQWPVRADHRFMVKLNTVALNGKAMPRPREFDRVSRVFSKIGGSWKRLFNGSVEDVNLLKKVMKVALKKGYLTKQEKWT